ncbi:MAG: protein kinase [Acidobacteriaceae bacterium]|nr:protein kinase [Acidobacteriaceae bacterium]
MNSRTKIERWNIIQEIFQAALERPLTERKTYISEACGDDEDLRSEVESLLANDADAETVLRSVLAGDIRDIENTANCSEAGLQLGPYRLVRDIDSGGMGSVYLGVRSDDQYFQIVAIKMVRKGVESPALIQRFRAERQILATLNHPNIGAILDGGETADGRPFIVMEYVEGQPITITCESQGMAIRQRVELFRSVCAAVHYAHQKLVIHRDIKPSNVLVNPQGTVKLIDFGVSKPLAPELMPGQIPKTETFQRLMTPDYASPEQFMGQELTTATDIYSLGVLLFELLTGSRPYTIRDLSPGAAENVICHQEHRKPSSVRGLPKTTRRELAGDLDRIVQMAMDRDPARRYQSAQHLDEDLLRYLEGKPVLARKATLLYTASKFIRRHRMASLMTCLTLLLLGGSLAYHTWQSRLADARVKHIQTSATSVISEMTDKLQQSSASVETQAALFQSALKYLQQLRQSSGNDPRVLVDLSKAYARVGDLQGSPTVGANLGNPSAAIGSYKMAVNLALESHARLPEDESTRAAISAYQKLGDVQSSEGDSQGSRDAYQHAVGLAADFWKQKTDDPDRKRLLVVNYSGLGYVEWADLKTDKALENFRSALERFGDTPNGKPDHDNTLIRLHWLSALALRELGSASESVANLRKSISIAETLVRDAPSDASAKRSLSVIYGAIVGSLAGDPMLNVGDSAQAQMYARRAVEIVEALAAMDRSNAQARDDLINAYSEMADSFRLTQPAVASQWYRKAIALTRQVKDTDAAQNWLSQIDQSLAAVLVRKHQATERLNLLREANAFRLDLAAKSAFNEPHFRALLMESYCTLSDAEAEAGNLARAKELANFAQPLLSEFKVTSPSLLVVRDIGLCDETMGNVQHRISLDRSLPDADKRAAAADSREWYQKSANAWAEWVRRGISNAETKLERRKVERLLQTSS